MTTGKVEVDWCTESTNSEFINDDRHLSIARIHQSYIGTLHPEVDFNQVESTKKIRARRDNVRTIPGLRINQPNLRNTYTGHRLKTTTALMSQSRDTISTK